MSAAGGATESIVAGTFFGNSSQVSKISKGAESAVDTNAISYNALDAELKDLSDPDVFLPWKKKNNPVVFQTGRNFENRLQTYNEEIESGRGRRKLKTDSKDLSNKKSLFDYLPYSVTDFLEQFVPVRGRLEAANAPEFDNLAGTESWKYKPLRNMAPADFGEPPDSAFYANKLVKLKNGVTAYRLIEPHASTYETHGMSRVIVCLHGLTDSSYTYSDLCELLSTNDDGPKARVLIFDFFGHGRSPWTGVPLSLDILVMQTKELLDVLYLLSRPISIIGFCLGGAVAVGFAAKYPDLVSSLTLIAPIGIRDMNKKNKVLRQKCLGDCVMISRSRKLAEEQLLEFYNNTDDCPHRPLINKQVAMVDWQRWNTPGYAGALLSMYRVFPFRMEELFSAVGRHTRPVLIIWGDRDSTCPYQKSIHRIEACFPNGFIVDVRNCGHSVLFEKYSEVASEILEFFQDLDL